MDQLVEQSPTLILGGLEFKRLTLTLVGCGGTGSHVASGLAVISQELQTRGVTTDVLFVDPDVVEARNIGRQLFSQADLGRAKAVVLAERLNNAFGGTVGAAVREIDGLDTFVEDETPIEAVGILPGDDHGRAGSRRREGGCINVVIGAVDNAPARKLIARQVDQADGRLWWLDTGNEYASGQVALGNRRRVRVELGMASGAPAPHVVWPDLVKGRRKRARAACGVEEQGLMVNRMTAAWACSMLADLLLDRRMRYFAVAFNTTWGNSRAWALDVPTIKELGAYDGAI